MRHPRAGWPPIRSTLRIPVLVLLGLAVTQSGCAPNAFVGYLASAAVGFVAGRLTAPIQVETRCFRNGEEVDCSLLPD